MTEPKNYLLYDGDCPVCARYIAMMRLRSALGEFALIDARKRPDLVALHRQARREINDGMILSIDGAVRHGAPALAALGALTTPVGWFNRLNARLFGLPLVAELLYWLMVRGRLLLLKLLGNSAIG